MTFDTPTARSEMKADTTPDAIGSPRRMASNAVLPLTSDVLLDTCQIRLSGLFCIARTVDFISAVAEQ